MAEVMRGTLEEVLDKAQALAREGTIAEVLVLPWERELILVKRPDSAQGPAVVRKVVLEWSSNLMSEQNLAQVLEQEPEHEWCLEQGCEGWKRERALSNALERANVRVTQRVLARVPNTALQVPGGRLRVNPKLLPIQELAPERVAQELKRVVRQMIERK